MIKYFCDKCDTHIEKELPKRTRLNIGDKYTNNYIVQGDLELCEICYDNLILPVITLVSKMNPLESSSEATYVIGKLTTGTNYTTSGLNIVEYTEPRQSRTSDNNY